MAVSESAMLVFLTIIHRTFQNDIGNDVCTLASRVLDLHKKLRSDYYSCLNWIIESVTYDSDEIVCFVRKGT